MKNIDERIIHLETRLQQAERRNDALQFVVSWILARHPGDDAMSFLSCQANELEASPRFEVDVAVLDELREEVLQWHAQWSSGPNTPR
jgi:hypothetical protein